MERIQHFMWKVYYAGRVMQRVRLPFSTAWRMANEADYLYDWRTRHPGELADYRLKMYDPHR